MEEIRWEGQNFSEVVAPQEGGGEEEEEWDFGFRKIMMNFLITLGTIFFSNMINLFPGILKFLPF